MNLSGLYILNFLESNIHSLLDLSDCMGMYVYLSPLPLTFFLLHRVKMEEQAHQMVWSLLISSKPLWPFIWLGAVTQTYSHIPYLRRSRWWGQRVHVGSWCSFSSREVAYILIESTFIHEMRSSQYQLLLVKSHITDLSCHQHFNNWI